MKKKIRLFFYPKKHFSIFRLALAFIFLLAFVLRIIGTNPGFSRFHPDEPVLYATSIHLVLNGTLDPFLAPTYKFQYPGFIIYLYAILFKFLFIPLNVAWQALFNRESFLQNISQMELFIRNVVVGPSYINAMFWSRYINAVWSFLSVPLVYLIGRKMFNKYVGLFAALFLTFNYRHMLSANFGLIDAPNATLALLVLYLSLVVYQNPTLRNYLFLAIALGLSMGTKLYVFSIPAFLFTHLLAAVKKKNKKIFIKELLSPKFFLAAATAVFVFLLFNPYLIFHFAVAKYTQKYNNLRYGLFYPPFEITFPPLWYLYEIGYGKIMAFLFLLGIFLIIKNKAHWVNGFFLSIFIILPMAVLIYFSRGAAYERNFTSVIPFAVIVSALAFWTIFERVYKLIIRNKKFYFPVLLLLSFVVTFDQIKNSVKLDYFASQSWNRSCMRQWMNENIKNGHKVAVNNLVPRSKNEGVSYMVFENKEDYKNAFTLSTLQEEKIDYVVANIEYLKGKFNWWISSNEMYWGPPIDIFDNSFDGLVLKELSRYIVKTCIKPWESPANNYIAVKIPPAQDYSNTLIFLQSHDFKSQLGKVWKLSNPFKNAVENDVKVIQSGDCRNRYCLKVEGKNGDPSRDKIILSERVPVEAGVGYVVKAMIKPNGKVDGKNRDGFLRLDYYSDKYTDYAKRGMIASISPRYFGDGSWKELTVSQVTPTGANYLQISFQVERYNLTFLIDDLKIYRVKEKPTMEEINASNRKEIDNEVLYPLSLL